MKIFKQKPSELTKNTPHVNVSRNLFSGRMNNGLNMTQQRDGWYVGSKLQESSHMLPKELQESYGAALGFSFDKVRVHRGDSAAHAAASLGARAFTIGQDIYFGKEQYQPSTLEGRKLIIHELTHTIQQRGFTAPKVGTHILPATTKQEAEAKKAPQFILQQKQFPVQYSSGPAVAMQGPDAGVVSGSRSAGTRVVQALNQPMEHGVGNPTEALTILRSLSGDELVAAVIEVDESFLLDVLIDTIGTNDRSEVGAVIYAVRFTSPNSVPDDRYGIQAAQGLAQLDPTEQDSIITRVLARRNPGVTLADVREGIQALEESEASLTAQGYEDVDDASTPVSSIMAGVTMGPWNPGRLPVPFYIGNSAHIAIAAEYASFHRGDPAFYNFTPISTILTAAQALGIVINPAAITAAQLGLKPDIINLAPTRRHLYEIKPASAQATAAAEARLYMAALIAAGLPIVLGPINELGTSGTLPAPGGWYVFSAPEPGVITYKYRQPRRRRVRVRAPQQSPAMDRSFMERMAAITGLTGTALIIYIIISEGSRVIPPRNLIPVP